MADLALDLDLDLDLDPRNLRDWLASVGLVRIVSSTTKRGRGVWTATPRGYRFGLVGVPDQIGSRSGEWLARNRSAWSFGVKNVGNLDLNGWRDRVRSSTGLPQTVWCSIACAGLDRLGNVVLIPSPLEYARGGGHQDWLDSMQRSMSATDEAGLERVLSGAREDVPCKGMTCRWDCAIAERQYAYAARDLDADPAVQDVTLNALAAVGLASCPMAPTRTTPVTPIAAYGPRGSARLAWPLWTEPMRIAELDAALCRTWSWPMMRAERQLVKQLYMFERGVLREP